MRTLSDTLQKAQQAGALTPLYKIVLTKGASSYTYEKDRILPSEHDEGMYSHRAKIVLNNRDHELDDKNLKGYDAIISYGFSKEYSATASLSVIDQQFNSDPDNLTCTLELEGIPNLMAKDEASEVYKPDEDDAKTVKTLVTAIVGATLAPFTHCHAYDVVWDDGYDTLADSYKAKDSFRVYSSGSRLAALRKILDYTANVPRFEADGKVHILKPVTSGETFDSEYSLQQGQHQFFSKAYRETLVFPNRIVVRSQPDDDPQYSGEAQIDGYDSLPAKVKKTKYVQVRLESNDQATSMAEALIAKAEMGAARGQAEIRINVGSEVFDYVKVTDQRQGDTRTGNLGYIHRRFGQDKWVMTFGFGNWLESLRYQNILKELETYTDAGQYFSRLDVGDLYAENLKAKNMGFYWIDPDNTIASDKLGPGFLDNLPDGEQFVRTSTWNMEFDDDPESPTYEKWVLKLDEHTFYQPGYDPNEKRRTFTSTPTTPYDIGDLWLDADTVKRCTTARATGAYQASDWMATTMDAIANGELFSRVKSASLTAEGLVLLDQVQEGTFGVVKKASLTAQGLVLLDQVAEGTYGLVKSTDISAGHIRLSRCEGDLDDIDEGSTYGKLSLLDMDAHHIKLSSYTKVSGEWYDNKGVLMNSAFGIRLYGGQVAFSTHPTHTDAVNNTNIQCSVDSSGRITAGGGDVILSSDGLILKGNITKLQTTGGANRGVIYADSDEFGISSASGIKLVLQATNSYIWMLGDKGMIIPRLSSNPSPPWEGLVYLNTTTDRPRIYCDGRWWEFQLTGV